MHKEIRTDMFEAVKVLIEQQTILNESLLTSSDPRKLFILYYQEDKDTLLNSNKHEEKWRKYILTVIFLTLLNDEHQKTINYITSVI